MPETIMVKIKVTHEVAPSVKPVLGAAATAKPTNRTKRKRAFTTILALLVSQHKKKYTCPSFGGFSSSSQVGAGAVPDVVVDVFLLSFSDTDANGFVSSSS